MVTQTGVVIVDYIVALLKGEDEKWKEDYNKEKKKEYEEAKNDKVRNYWQNAPFKPEEI